MFNNMCGPTNKEHDWHEIGKSRPRLTLVPETSGCFSDQHESVSIQYFNREHSQPHSNVLYSHHEYINDTPNNLPGDNEWQYKSRSRPTSNCLHRSKPTNSEYRASSSPRSNTEMHIDSSNTNKTYFESDDRPIPYHHTEQNVSPKPRPTMYADDRSSFNQHSQSDDRPSRDIAVSSTPLNSEPYFNGERWANCENTSPERAIPVELGPVLERNLSRSNLDEVIKDKCKDIKVGSSNVTDRPTRNEVCEISRPITKYSCQNNTHTTTVKEGPSDDEYDGDFCRESSSGGDSDESSLSSGVSKINCRDVRTKNYLTSSRDEEDHSEGDVFNISCDNIEQQIANFYQLACDKCVSIGSEKLTFTTHTLFTEHCHEKHGSEGEVRCCGQSMWLKEELLEHMQEHKTLIWCAKCQKSFVNRTLWKKHMHEHVPKTADVGPYCCPHCTKQFSSKYGLTNHMNLHLPEDERPFKCRHCNKGFGAKHAMSKHERTHLPDEERLSYVCDKCGKRFGYASTLDGHQKHVHQNERPFVCHVCAKTFPIKGALTYHLTTHEVQDRVQCTDCGIWLKNEKILRIHKKCHQGDLYACPHCDKVSNTRNNLRMHMKRHSDARPHPCPLCARAFKTPRDLKTHMVQHTGQKPYSCPYCPKTFASPSNFYAHRKMKHKVAAPIYEDPPSTISNLQSY